MWSDSGTNNGKSKECQNQMEDENYVTKYSDAINNEINVDSESSEEEENEYFRKYREEMKKAFQI